MVALRIFLVLLAATLCGSHAHSQESRFQAGEVLKYHIYYHLWGVWVGAGNVTFSVKAEEYRGTDCYKFEGVGRSLKRYDFFYKVRDTYSAYADVASLKPYKFSRNVNEGGFYFKEENIYDHTNDRVISLLKVKENDMKIDTFPFQEDSYDVMTLMYYCMNLDYTQYEEGEKIPIKMVIDRETHELFVRYLGIQPFEHDEMGELQCHVIAPLLVEGSIFRAGERMKVYFSADENQVPVYVESDIRVGSIRSELVSASGLKHLD